MCPEAHTIGGGDQVFWLDAPVNVVGIVNAVASVAWTDFDCTAATSANAAMVMLFIRMRVDVLGGGGITTLAVRKNGTAPNPPPAMSFFNAEVTVAQVKGQFVIVGCDTGQVVEYDLTLGAGWTIDGWIDVLGYIE